MFSFVLPAFGAKNAGNQIWLKRAKHRILLLSEGRERRKSQEKKINARNEHEYYKWAYFAVTMVFCILCIYRRPAPQRT